jgi:hypothetical protein
VGGGEARPPECLSSQACHSGHQDPCSGGGVSAAQQNLNSRSLLLHADPAKLFDQVDDLAWRPLCTTSGRSPMSEGYSMGCLPARWRSLPACLLLSVSAFGMRNGSPLHSSVRGIQHLAACDCFKRRASYGLADEDCVRRWSSTFHASPKDRDHDCCANSNCHFTASAKSAHSARFFR